MNNRQLKFSVTGAIEAIYRRTDVLDGNSTAIRGDLIYKELKRTFTNGAGGELNADLFFQNRYNLNNSVLLIDLDGELRNVWNDALDFDSVKYVIIHNRESIAGRYLSVRLKDERYYIGPGGYRVICEPQGKGIDAIESSSSSEEGTFAFSTDTDVTFDLIIAGSSQESSSSTSGV
jgi:hypothetical protein